MTPQILHRSQNDDLLSEIREAQAVLRAAWQTYPDMPEVTGVLGLLRTKLEHIEQQAIGGNRRPSTATGTVRR
ncbi:MAG TPA: hypothetical protein PKI21_03275 [Nitrospira sp.]|jgi:hypothetical protein|nr:hypothetical protein [Nitrospira sp.]HPV82280.1 hypothetical protein [Nitrospira sp.]